MATAPPIPQQSSSTNPQDNQGPIQPGVTVPVEEGQGTNPQPGDMGPNYENMEKLKPKWVSTLRDLVMKYRMEGLVSRRQEIRRNRLARLYWQGLQYAWWDPGNFNWNLPFQSRFDDDTNIEQQPRYQFVTNYYKGFGLTFVSLLSQDVPTVRWYPKSATNVQDIYAAKAAGDVSDLIERNNDPTQLLRDIAYYFWTDGKCAAYVRYVADGERFGYQPIPELEASEKSIGSDTYVCPNCGARTPADKGMFAGGMACPECGEPLDNKALQPAPVVPTPKVKAVHRIPNGQETITIVGGLEFNTPVWCREWQEMPYCQWQVEVHRSKLRAVYPHVADKIQAGEPQDAEDVYARVSRLASSQGLPQVHPADALYAVVTFTRTWLDPAAFMEIDDKEIRAELMKEFDKGCYVAFAGSTYCEARNENRRKCWAFKSAEPGDGSARPGVGDGMIQIQERYNTLSNIQAETYEYAIPAGYCDPETISAEAWASQTSEPGSKYPARAKGGQPLQNSFFFEPAANVPRDMVQHMQDLVGPVAQFVTGLFPAIFGGEVEGAGGDTAKGYAMARDQAMGRIGLVWRSVKELWADMMFLALQCFKDNRAEDVPVPILGDDGEFDERVIHLADLQGNLIAYPEPDETFPRLKSQQRAVYQVLMQSEDPFIMKALTEPSNLGTIRSALGLTDLVVPGEDSANKQKREIDQMLKSAPTQVPQMGPDGVTPALDPSGNPIPMDMTTVPVDPLLDDHAVEFEECKRWANSEEGQQAKAQNPPGYANVHAHAQAHFKLMQAQMMAEQAASGVRSAQGKTE